MYEAVLNGQHSEITTLVQQALGEGMPVTEIIQVKVLKAGGRHIAGSSHSITNFIPHENYITMLNAIHHYGVY
jgi:methanogenic corrinoid protein MtbC1